MQCCARPLPCSEESSERRNCFRKASQKENSCLQCLPSLTCCFPFANLSLSCYVSLVKKQFFTQLGLSPLLKSCNVSSSALTMQILWLLMPAIANKNKKSVRLHLCWQRWAHRPAPARKVACPPSCLPSPSREVQTGGRECKFMHVWAPGESKLAVSEHTTAEP